jgi:predicted molibdopterin-dependent oxidoreductase YjgC
MIYQDHTGTMTRNSPTLDREVDSAYVELNPADAHGLGIADGGRLKVASRRGELTLEARLTDRVKPGEVFIPFHFAESPANVLTNDALDPVSRIPELKVCAVRVERAGS